MLKIRRKCHSCPTAVHSKGFALKDYDCHIREQWKTCLPTECQIIIGLSQWATLLHDSQSHISRLLAFPFRYNSSGSTASWELSLTSKPTLFSIPCLFSTYCGQVHKQLLWTLTSSQKNCSILFLNFVYRNLANFEVISHLNLLLLPTLCPWSSLLM